MRALHQTAALLLTTACLAGCPAAETPAGQDLASAPADMAQAPDQPSTGGSLVVVRFEGGAPAPGVDVITNDAEGAVVKSYKTDAAGQVEVAVPPGGTVAALQSDGANRYIDAVAAPPPGVRIAFTGRAPAKSGALPTQLELTIEKVPMGATQVRFYSGCSSGTQGTDVPILKLPACEIAGKYDIIAVATDNTNKRLGWGALLAQTPRPGETVTGTIPLDRADFVSADVEITGVAAGRRATVRLSPRSELFVRVSSLTDRANALSPPMGKLAARLTLPALAAEGFRTVVSTSRDVPESAKNTFLGTVSRTRYFQSLPMTVSDAIDAVPEVTIKDPDLSDPARPRYAWQLSAPFRGDGAALQAVYDTDEGSLTYSLTFPVDQAPALRLPEVPAALAAYAVDKAALHSFGQVSYFDYDGVTGYAEFLDAAKVAAATGFATNYSSFSLKP